MKNKKLPTGLRILLAFISVLLSIVLFVSTVALILVTDIRVVTSKDGLQTIISQALFPGMARPVYSPLASGATDFGGLTDGTLQDGLVDSIYELIKDQLGEDIPVSKEDVEAVVSQSTLPEFLADKTAGIVSDIFNGELTTTITKEEVMDLIEENKPLIENTLDITIPAEVVEAVGDWLDENDVTDTFLEEVAEVTGMELPARPNGDSKPGSTVGDTGSTGKPSTPSKPQPEGDQIIGGILSGEVDVSQLQIAEILAIVRTVSSNTVLLTLIGICVLLLGLLMLTHWGRPFAAVRTAGIPVLVAGVVMSLLVFLITLLPIPLASSAEALIMQQILRQILNMTSNVSLFFALGGLVLIVAGTVLNSVMKKRRCCVSQEPIAPMEPVAVPAAEEAAAPEVPEEVPQETE